MYTSPISGNPCGRKNGPGAVVVLRRSEGAFASKKKPKTYLRDTTK
jgi:hypothetical protein